MFVDVMADRILLGGLGIEGYRSFSGGSVQRIGLQSKINLLAGPNNSGESNVLRVAQQLLDPICGRGSPSLENHDRPCGQPLAPILISVAQVISADELQERPRIGHGDANKLIDLLRASPRAYCRSRANDQSGQRHHIKPRATARATNSLARADW
jgi:hypothetical protein